MRAVLICPDDLLEHVVTAAAFPGERPLYLVSRASLRARLARRGDRAVAGKVTDATFLHEAFKGGRGPVVVAAPAGQLARVIAAVKDAVPDAPLLVLRDDDRHVSNATVVPLSRLRRAHRPARARAGHAAGPRRADARPLLRRRARADPHAGRPGPRRHRLRARAQDPAGPHPRLRAACAPSAPSRGPRTWPCARSSRSRSRQIDAAGARPVRPRGHGGRAALVPGGGAHFREVDLVIDHHPVEQPIRARIKDVRPSYGATSTIMVEYLRAADVKITPAAGHRAAVRHQVRHPRPRARRHQGRPRRLRVSLPARQPQRAPPHRAAGAVPTPPWTSSPGAWPSGAWSQGVFFSHLGRVATVDLIPQFADFGLQAEGVEWSVVSGVVDDEVHVSVRNVGYVRSAGDVTRAAFGELGIGGRAPDHGQGGDSRCAARPRRRATGRERRLPGAHHRAASCGRSAATPGSEGSPS